MQAGFLRLEQRQIDECDLSLAELELGSVLCLDCRSPYKLG